MPPLNQEKNLKKSFLKLFFSSKKIFYFILFSLVAVFCAGPLSTLLFQVSPENYIKSFTLDATARALKNTFLLSTSVAICCTLIGVPLAWLLTRTDLKGAKFFKSLLSLPYAIPAYIGAIGWIVLANPQSGILNHVFGSSIVNIYSFQGLVFVETSFLFTFSFLVAHSSLNRMDSSLEEAARVSGATGLRVFLDISLPLLKPAVINSFILVFLATAASFGVPALIGTPARIPFLTTQIFNFQRMATENGIQVALALSSILMVTSLGLLFSAQKLLFNSQSAMVGGKTSRPSLVPLGVMGLPFSILISTFLFVILILPILSLLLSSLSPVQGDWDLTKLSFSNFQRVLFETEETTRALTNSMTFAFGTAFGLAIIAFFAGYFLSKTKFVGKNLFEALASLPFSTPGTVVALALIISFSSGFWGVGPSLYNTMGLLLIAYGIKYLSLSIKTVRDGFDQIDTSLEEAARISGANWLQVMRTIYLPLLRPALLTAVFLVVMPVFSELTMTILLTGPGLETIGTLIYQLQEYSDMGGGGASVLSLLVIGITVPLVFITNFLTRKNS